MKSKILSIRTQPIDVDGVVLLIRIVCGCAFIIFGWGKIQNPLNWMGDDSVFPKIFQALAAVSEFCGGIAWVIGFLTRFASFGIGCTMAVATYMHSLVWGDPFVNMAGGNDYHSALIFFCIALLLLLAGPGRFSLDRILFGVTK